MELLVKLNKQNYPFIRFVVYINFVMIKFSVTLNADSYVQRD